MFEELKELITNYVEVDPSDIKPESKFIDDLGFNSFDFVSLLGEVEEKFGVSVNEEDILDLSTVEDAVKYIEKLKG